MKKSWLVILTLYLAACTEPPAATETAIAPVEQTDTTDTVTALEQEAVVADVYRAELTKRSKETESAYVTVLDSVILELYENDEPFLRKAISKADFVPVLKGDFMNDGELFRAELLKLDTINQTALVKFMFGIPHTDVMTDLILVSDFQGNGFPISAPQICYPSVRVKGNRIATCNGIYTYQKQVFKIDKCCIVFSCMMSEDVFFYVSSDPYHYDAPGPNAYYIDINSKDTLQQFSYDEYTHTIGYSSLMWYSDELQRLTYINREDSTINVVDSLLKTSTYKISDVTVNNDLARDLEEMTYLYSIEVLDKPIIVRYNSSGEPVEIKK